MGVALKKYIWVLSLLFTVVISFLLAKVATIFIEASFFPDPLITAAPSQKSISIARDAGGSDIDADAIIRRNFFDPKESVFASERDSNASDENKDQANNQDKPKDDDPKDDVPKNKKAVPTELNITLVSTVAVGNGKNDLSSCVVKAGRGFNTYRLRDKEPFGPRTKIVQIFAKKVEFTNKGRLEYVSLEDFLKKTKGRKPRVNKTPTKTIARRVSKTDATDKPAAGDIERDGNTFKIPRVEIDKALNNIARLYTDIRAVPFFEEGRPMGFKLLSVKKGSLFEKLGLRRGDVLKSVNGQVLDIQSGLQTFNTLKSESEFKLELKRRGEEQSFSYEIVD